MSLPLIGPKDVEAVTSTIFDVILQTHLMNKGANLVSKTAIKAVKEVGKKNILHQAAATATGLLGANLAKDFVIPAVLKTPSFVKGVSDAAFSSYYNSGMVAGGTEGFRMGVSHGAELYLNSLKEMHMLPAIGAIWSLCGVNPVTRVVTRVGGAALVIVGTVEIIKFVSQAFTTAVAESGLMDHLRNQMINELDRLYSLGLIKAKSYDKMLLEVTKSRTVKDLSSMKAEIFKYD